MKIIITAELILNMIPFTSLEKYRDNLKAIHIEYPYMIATDGKRIMVYNATNDLDFMGEEPPTTPIAINLADCRKLLTSMLKDKDFRKKNLGVVYCTETHTFTFPNGQTVLCGAFEGGFPGWKHVIPGNDKIGTPTDHVFVNPDLLTDFQAFNGNEGVAIYPAGENLALIAINNHCFGLLALMNERFMPEKEPMINMVNSIKGDVNNEAAA